MNSFINKNSSSPLLIGMIHLLASPGYADHKGFDATLEYALNDLEALTKGGFNAVLIENDNDKPHTVTATYETICFMAAIGRELVKHSTIPVGVEVLLNDPKASLAIAATINASFIRTDYFVDKMSRPEYGGEMYINPAEILEYRKKLNIKQVAILADLQVKYATLLEPNKSIEKSLQQAEDAGADAVIITGNFTGEQPKLNDLIAASSTQTQLPILVGSGFDITNAQTLLKYAQGAIVGSSIKEGDFNSPVSIAKATELVQTAHKQN